MILFTIDISSESNYIFFTVPPLPSRILGYNKQKEKKNMLANLNKNQDQFFQKKKKELIF